MYEEHVFDDIISAARDNDTSRVDSLLSTYPGIVNDDDFGEMLFSIAIEADSDELARILKKHGVDIHKPERAPAPEGFIERAAGRGSVKVAKWLLSQGVEVNRSVNGSTRCLALTKAAFGGHLEVVKLLVEYGADINAVWIDQNALSMAMMYGKSDVVAYLESKGALEPSKLQSLAANTTAEDEETDSPPLPEHPLLSHIEQHLGMVDPVPLQEVVPGDPPVAIYVVLELEVLALVTVGMSDRAMTVPPGGDDFKYAELVFRLPMKWPLEEKDLKNPNHSWPIKWLRRLARYPHQKRTWLGGQFAVFANGDPPQPLAPNTPMTAILVFPDPDDEFRECLLPDGRKVFFYRLLPIHTQERDYEIKHGIPALLRLFTQNKVRMIVDVNRPSVV